MKKKNAQWNAEWNAEIAEWIACMDELRAAPPAVRERLVNSMRAKAENSTDYKTRDKAIRDAHKAGVSQAELARRYGLSKQRVGIIIWLGKMQPQHIMVKCETI